MLATGGFERDPQLARAFLRGPMLAPVGAPVGARRRPAARDRRGRPARLDERGLVVPGGPDPGRHDRRRADVPADPDRARATGLPARQRSRRRFVDEAQNYNDLGRDAAELRADVLLVPERAGLAHLRRRVSRDVPARARCRAAIPIPTGSRAARRSAELAAEIGVPADALEATVARFNEGAGRGRRPRLRPRQLPLRPLHRRPRAARAGAVLRVPGTPGLPRHEGRPEDGRRTAACSRSRTGARSRASTPRATRRPARSGSPTPAPAGRSARLSCSAPGRARRRPGD